MLKITDQFLADCSGLLYHPMYDGDRGMFCDPQGVNFWVGVGPGRARPAVLLNQPLDDSPIPRATCEALAGPCVATDDGGVVIAGVTYHLADDLSLVQAS